MTQVMLAAESVVALPACREQALAAAPAIARAGTSGPLGAFFGHDFHLSQRRPGLIEINTNADGATLNVVLARAQRACCTAVGHGPQTGERGCIRAKSRLVLNQHFRSQR